MEIPEADRAEYVDTVKRLLAIPVPENPKAVELDGDADKIAESFFYEIEKEMEDASILKTPKTLKRAADRQKLSM